MLFWTEAFGSAGSEGRNDGRESRKSTREMRFRGRALRSGGRNGARVCKELSKEAVSSRSSHEDVELPTALWVKRVTVGGSSIDALLLQTNSTSAHTRTSILVSSPTQLPYPMIKKV